LRGLRRFADRLSATEQQLFRAARNAGSQTATASRKRGVDQISGGTRLKKKVVRDRLPVYRATLNDFKRDGIAAKIVPRGPARYPVKMEEYKPRPVQPASSRYAVNRTRRAVLVKQWVDEPAATLPSNYFINPVHDRRQVWRRRSNGQHVPVLYGPPIHEQFDRILPDLERWTMREYRQRFDRALAAQVARGRR
jgi:hypothetical protein